MTEEQARRVEDLAREANSLRKRGRYDEAVAKLKEAAGIYSAPWLLYNLGRTYEEAGKLELARAHFELCFGRNASERVRKRAKKALARIENASAFGALEIADWSPTQVLLVDGEAYPVPLDGRLDLLAGTHRVRVERPGHLPHEQDVVIKKGETTVVGVDLLREPQAGPAPAPLPASTSAPPASTPAPAPRVSQTAAKPRDGGGSYWKWVTLAGGLVSVGGGTVAWVAGSGDWRDLNAAMDEARSSSAGGAPVVSGYTQREAGDLVDSGRAKRTGGAVAVGVGTALLVTSAVLFATAEGGSSAAASSPPPLLPRLTLSPSSTGLAVGGSF